MKLPAYGRTLHSRRRAGERPGVVCLLVGNSWRLPAWLPSGVPKLAVKTAPWHRVVVTESAETAQRKESARSAVREALRDGRLQRGPCEICGHANVEPHHPSYQEPRWLDVRWLCATHHAAVHVVQRRALRDDPVDWRVVATTTVLAVDTRAEDEIEYGSDGWDAWFWLLADVQRHACEVLLFTPTITFYDPPNDLAPERTLELFAWLNRGAIGADGERSWPVWWRHDELRGERAA